MLRLFLLLILLALTGPYTPYHPIFVCSIKESIFATPWQWQPLARSGAIITAAPNPSANTSSRGHWKCCLRLVWADSSWGGE
jgi:hypothetical protein